MLYVMAGLLSSQFRPPGLVTRCSVEELLSARAELQEPEAASGRPDELVKPEVRGTHTQAVEPPSLQGARQSPRDAAGRRQV